MDAARKKLRLETDDHDSSAGQRALMRAVLEDAILCLRGHGRPTRDRARLAAEAEHWVTSTDRRWPFSFESVCDVLGLEAGYLRRRLLHTGAARTPGADGREGGAGATAPDDDMVDALRRARNPGNQTTRELR